MDRGLRSQLSPNEEITLRLLSIAGHDQDLLRLADLAQLHALRLTELCDGVWKLTEMGLQRLSKVAKKR